MTSTSAFGRSSLARAGDRCATHTLAGRATRRSTPADRPSSSGWIRTTATIMSRAPACEWWISVVTRGSEIPAKRADSQTPDSQTPHPSSRRAPPLVFALVDPWWSLRDSPVNQLPLETEWAPGKLVGDLCHRARSMVGGCERSTRRGQVGDYRLGKPRLPRTPASRAKRHGRRYGQRDVARQHERCARSGPSAAAA